MGTPEDDASLRSQRLEFFLREHCIRRLQGWVVYIGLIAFVFAAIAIYSRIELFQFMYRFVSDTQLQFVRRVVYILSIGLASWSVLISRRLNDHEWLSDKVSLEKRELSHGLMSALEDVETSERVYFILLMVTYKLENQAWNMVAWIALVGSIPFLLGASAVDFMLYLGISAGLLLFHRPTVSELEESLENFDVREPRSTEALDRQSNEDIERDKV